MVQNSNKIFTLDPNWFRNASNIVKNRRTSSHLYVDTFKLQSCTTSHNIITSAEWLNYSWSKVCGWAWWLSHQNSLVQHLTALHVSRLNVNAVSPTLPVAKTHKSLFTAEKRAEVDVVQWDSLTLACLWNTWCRAETCSLLRTGCRAPRGELRRQKCLLTSVHVGVSGLWLSSVQGCGKQTQKDKFRNTSTCWLSSPFCLQQFRLENKKNIFIYSGSFTEGGGKCTI